LLEEKAIWNLASLLLGRSV